MRRYAVTVALVTLAACGGGDPAPRATPAPSGPPASVPPTTVPPSSTPAPEGIVRAAVAKTLAACPCSVEVALWTKDPAESYLEILRGVYDAKSGTTELRQVFNGKETDIYVRYVDGRAFTTISRRQWNELLHSRLPAKPVSPFLPLAVGDPRIPFSVAGAVRTSAATLTHEGATLYEVEFDVAAAAGPRGRGARWSRGGRSRSTATAACGYATDSSSASSGWRRGRDRTARTR